METVDVELIQKAQQGDSEAFKEIYTKYYQSVFYHALKLSKNEADAYDITQETFIQVFRFIKDVRNPEYFNFWLHRIVHNKFLILIKKNSDIVLEDQSLHHFLEQSELAKKLNEKSPITDIEVFQKLIDKLSPKQAEVLRIMYFEQKTITEMAAILNCPEGTVKSRIAQAKKMLAINVSKFQEAEARKMSFQNHALIPSVILLLCSKIKNIFSYSFTSQSILTLSTISMVAVSGVALVQTDDYIKKSEIGAPLVKKVNFSSIVYDEESIDNAKEAYYTLLNWAESEDAQQTKEDIMPIYESLKKTNSEYLQLIEDNPNWNKFF